jgi:hypothetical protein
VLAFSHANWTHLLTRGRPSARWAVAGSVLPDSPAILRGAWVLGRGTPRAEAIRQIYRLPPWRYMHLSAHSVWGPLVLGALARGPATRSLAAGWAGHLAVDYATHHDDAWPPFWPAWNRRFRSPLSYWQPEYRAIPVLGVDLAVGLFALRRPTPLALAAVVSTALALRTASGRGAGSPRSFFAPPLKQP